MTIAVVTVYFMLLTYLSLHGAHRLWLATFGRIQHRGRVEAGAEGEVGHWPEVLVQIPLYNESLVARRAIEAAARLGYRGKMCIQILDDSTDYTRRVVDRAAGAAKNSGVDIVVLRRGERTGFKAGALAHGLAQSKAEFVAIFDADFVPPPDFLERVVPVLLQDESCGLVQARWGHLNREESWLTRAQAVLLDGHFAVEHSARSRLGLWFNFNGTAGVWRRRAIEDAGGWSSQTLTEDLDLSLRAQLVGWRFRYVGDVVAPGELPASWTAFRVQQSRWVRGGLQTARMHLRSLLRAKRTPFWIRFDAALQLTTNANYVFMALLATFLPVAIVLRDQLGWRVPGGRLLLSSLDITMLCLGTSAMVITYGIASWRVTGRLSLVRFAEILFALSVGAGLSVSNAFQALRGLTSRDCEFVRTPKKGKTRTHRALRIYKSTPQREVTTIELLFAGYYLLAVVYAVSTQLFWALPFLSIYLVGFLAVGAGNLFDGFLSRLREPGRRNVTSSTCRDGGGR